MKVKICGLTRIEDIEIAQESGADALGFVLERSSPRFVGDRADLMDHVAGSGPYAVVVAVFGTLQPYPTPPFSLSQFSDAGKVESTTDYVLAIRLSAEDRVERILTLIEGSTLSESPEGGGSFASPQGRLRAILLDAYHPRAQGGTGRQVDWNLAAEIVTGSAVPVILAGGLTPDNVADAIRIVRPYAVDVSSGVELSPGIKDPHKVRDFIQAAKDQVK